MAVSRLTHTCMVGHTEKRPYSQYNMEPINSAKIINVSQSYVHTLCSKSREGESQWDKVSGEIKKRRSSIIGRSLRFSLQEAY